MNRKSSTVLSAVALLTLGAMAPSAGAQCTGYNLTITTPQPVMAGIADIGNHGDDIITVLPLPFPVSIYGQTFPLAVVCSNGQLTLGPTGTGAYSNTCLPSGAFPGVALAPFWDDLRTDGPGQGIFTATFGLPPGRTFIIEWRAGYYGGAYTGTADFAVIFREGQTFIDFEYLNVSDGAGGAQSEGAGSTVGVQASGSGPASQMECNTGGLFNGEVIRFTCAPYRAPTCSVSLSPSSVPAGGASTAFCTVTPGNGPVSTGLATSLDGTPVGAGIIDLHDNGVWPDAAARDGTYSGMCFPAAATGPGSYTLTASLTDAQGRSSTCAAGLTVTAAAPCSGYDATVYQGQGFVPAFTDTGNHGDDDVTAIALPFPVSIYGQTFTQATVCSNGQMTMGPSGSTAYFNECLPSGDFLNVALAPFWDDLRTDGPGQGIFTATYGSAPNRHFVIEWRAGYYSGYSGVANFEVLVHEGLTFFDFDYGTVNDGAGSAQSEGSGSTIGIQRSSSGPWLRVGCNAGGLSNGEYIRFTCAPYTPLSCSLALPSNGGDAGTSFNAFCTVAPGTGPSSNGLSVWLDVGSVGGGAVTLHDDGVPPDSAPNDNIFSGTVTTATGAPPGEHTLTATVTDSQGGSSTCPATYTLLAPNNECFAPIPAVLGDNPFDNSWATDSYWFFPDSEVRKDLWYAFSTPAAGPVRVTTCGRTAGDTAIAAYLNCSGYYAMSTSNYNYCGLQSTIMFCAEANRTYLLRIGSSGGAWTGTFNVSAPAPTPFNPPADAISENEPCNFDINDMVNGGCNFTPNRFTEAALCHSYSGQVWRAFQYGRDLDHYHFTMPAAGTLHVTGQATFPASFQVYSYPCGSATFYASTSVAGTGCSAGAVGITTPLPAGDYMLTVGSTWESGEVGCSPYWFRLNSDTFDCTSRCCRRDYNGDGDIGTDADIEDFFRCLGGACCAACPPDADFNCDGDTGTDADIESFFRLLAGGPC